MPLVSSPEYCVVLVKGQTWHLAALQSKTLPDNMRWAFGEVPEPVFYSGQEETANLVADCLRKCAPCTAGDVTVTIQKRRMTELEERMGVRPERFYREGSVNGESAGPNVPLADLLKFLGLPNVPAAVAPGPRPREAHVKLE